MRSHFVARAHERTSFGLGKHIQVGADSGEQVLHVSPQFVVRGFVTTRRHSRRFARFLRQVAFKPINRLDCEVFF